MRVARWALLACCLWAVAAAEAPALYRTQGYESPVQGGPGDLLLIGGFGFQAGDRVVYQAYGATAHPAGVPITSTAVEGVAEIVKLGTPPYALTVRLPMSLERQRAYRLWVVDAAGEWSQSVSINDPRPLWVTPAYNFATSDLAGFGRLLRIVGRNLGTSTDRPMQIQLRGPHDYLLTTPVSSDPSGVQNYVAEASLPARLEKGSYSVAVSRDSRNWTMVPNQQFEVRADPVAASRNDISNPKFGGCHADDEDDDTGCFRQALEAAAWAGSGTVYLPAGTWHLSVRQMHGDEQRNGFILPQNVNVQGAGAKLTTVIRHDAKESRTPGALLTLTGNNSVTGITFTDDAQYESLQQSRATIQLGIPQPAAALVEGIVISDDDFHHVGRAVVDSGHPIQHLFVTHNEFAGYDNGLLLTGSGAGRGQPYRIDDSVVRDNRFVPGSYLDVPARQGTVATQLGAATRLDFSSNVADGSSPRGLQRADDPAGWRAAFFWNLSNNQEEVLIAQNEISCPGDKAGDGEAISLDGNGATFGFDAASKVEAAGADWVRVRTRLRQQQYGQTVPADYYRGHWVAAVDGRGIGQVRRVASYSEDAGTGMVTLHVSPDWDVVPRGARLVVNKQYWQVYVVANKVEQGDPPCSKSNMTNARGGVIAFWAPIADSTIEANSQHEADGIEVGQLYDDRAPSMSFATAIEVRNNLIDGEYDWNTDCSWSGIRAYFTALLRDAQTSPPILGFGLLIAHNTITKADGQRGGAIDFARAGPTGPPPGNWPLLQNPLIFGNTIRDLDGPAPRPQCRQGQQARSGIRLEGPGNVRDAVLMSNHCQRVATHLEDFGTGTLRVCELADGDSCECEKAR
jgi:hypothetical protein